MELYMIVAVGRDGAIGLDGDLIWRIPADLKRFKTLTMGHPVIMGRKTWESLPKRPLPGRLNIVLTRDAGYEAPGATVAATATQALACAEEGMPGKAPFVIGGEQVYKLFMPQTTHIYLTEVDAECGNADARLSVPPSEGEWLEEDRSGRFETAEGIGYEYVTLVKKI